MDNPKIKRSLPIEFETKNCSYVIFIRDLDGFKSEEEKVTQKISWFESLDKLVNNTGVLLLNIWELEGLILSDIETFNKLYQVNSNFKGDPMMQQEPKEMLMKLTAKSRNPFKESHCPKIFKELDIDRVERKCGSFRSFINEFDKKLAS